MKARRARGDDHGLQIYGEYLSQRSRSISTSDLSHPETPAALTDSRPAGFLECLGDRLEDKGVLGHIADEIARTARRQIGRRFRFQIDHRHIGARGQEVAGNIEPHAAAGAGDDRGLVGEGHQPRSNMRMRS
jgi:hypothetical protein